MLRQQSTCFYGLFVRIGTRIFRATGICSAQLAFRTIRRFTASSFVHLAQGTVLDRCVPKLPGLFVLGKLLLVLTLRDMYANEEECGGAPCGNVSGCSVHKTVW